MAFRLRLCTLLLAVVVLCACGAHAAPPGPAPTTAPTQSPAPVQERDGRFWQQLQGMLPCLPVAGAQPGGEEAFPWLWKLGFSYARENGIELEQDGGPGGLYAFPLEYLQHMAWLAYGAESMDLSGCQSADYLRGCGIAAFYDAGTGTF